MNETLTLTLENYADVHFSTCSKRGLVERLGQISRFLFGTAMDSDVQELRKKYSYLTSVAEAQNIDINLNSNI